MLARLKERASTLSADGPAARKEIERLQRDLTELQRED
jgi:hypothetical protein